MRKTVWAVTAALFLAAASVLAGEDPRVPPPPPRTEAPTLQPSPAHVWLPGYWKWAGINYEWVDGRWAVGKKNRVWTPGTWEQVGNRWFWTDGRWTNPAAEAKAKAKAEKKAAQRAAKAAKKQGKKK